MAKRDAFEKIMIFCVLVFGLWQFVSTISVFIGLTFNQLKIAAIPYVLLLIGASYFFFRSSTVTLVSERAVRRYFPFHTNWQIKLLTAIGILILYWLSKNFLLFWILSIALLLWTFFDIDIDRKDGSKHLILPAGVARSIVAALALAIAIIALCLKTQDGDVAFILNVIVSALDYPDRALLSFDGMHGDKNIPMLSPIYLVQSYELLVALVSSLSGINEADLFYLVFPALFAAFIIIANWVVLRLFSGENAVVGVIVIFFLLLTWGVGGKTYGSYALNFIFLSKASIAVVWTPILIYLAIGFAEAPAWDKWLLLLIGQAAAINMSTTSLVIAPLVIGTTLLASLRFDWHSIKTMLLGLLSTAYVLLLGLWVMSEAQATGGLEPIMHAPNTSVAHGTTDGLDRLLGSGLRHYLAFMGLFACAILPGIRSSQRWRSGLVLVAFIFIINPWTPEFLTQHIAWNLYWRVFWAVPFPFFIGLAAASYMAMSPKLNSMRSGVIVIAVFLFIFGVSGKIFLHKHRLARPSHKVGWFYHEAEFIAGRTTPEDLVLAPERVAHWLTTFHHSPRLLVSREHYLLHWQSNVFPPREIRARHNLHNFVSGIESQDFSLQDAMKEILDRNINVILFPKDLEWREPFSEALREAGFMVTEIRADLLWEKPAVSQREKPTSQK